MIRLNRNNLKELIINKEDLEKILENDTDFDHQLIILEAIKDVEEYEQTHALNLEDIRVERKTAVGCLLFEQARTEIATEECLLDSLLLHVFNQAEEGEDILDNFSEYLKKAKIAPPDYVVEYALTERKESFTNKEKAPFCIKTDTKTLEKKISTIASNPLFH